MKLSLRDKIALIYTSAGSLSNVGSLVGVSASKISKLLREEWQGGYSDSSSIRNDKELAKAVNVAFNIHKNVLRQQAKIDDLPFSKDIPIFSARMVFRKGENKGVPGDRVEAPHTHWISNKLRDAWLKEIYKTKKYANVSIGSIVDLRTDQIISGKSEERRKRMAVSIAQKLLTQNRYKLSIKQLKKIKQYLEDENYFAILKTVISYDLVKTSGLIQTKYVPFSGQLSQANTLKEINLHLKEKHEPAITSKNNVLATRILFQVDTRRGKDDKFRQKHVIVKTKTRRARKNKKT